MSQLQRVIVRSGLEANIPALRTAEVGWDIDTKTLRVGDDSHDPVKILTTKSTGDFDFTSANSVRFKNLIVDTIAGADISSMYGDAPGFVVAVDNQGNFRNSKLVSSDGSVEIVGGTGESGEVDIRVSTATIGNALDDIRQTLAQIIDEMGDITDEIDTEKQKVANLILLSGRPANASNLGLFNGNVLPANISVKTALQALSNKLEELESEVTGEGFEIRLYNRTSEDFIIGLTNGSEITVPAVNAIEDKAGLMLSADKHKLDLITVTEDINLDDLTDRVTDAELSITSLQSATEDLDERVTVLESAVDNRISPFYAKQDDGLLWESTQTDTSTLIQSGGLPFIIEIERIGTTTANFEYSEVKLNDLVIMTPDHPVHTSQFSILVFKKGTDWYYTAGNSTVVKLPVYNEQFPTSFLLAAGNNAVRVFQALSI